MGLRTEEVIAGAAGAEFANEFLGFVEVWDNLPDLDQCEDDPLNAVVPTEESALYATALALSQRLNAENFENLALKYFPRMDDDFHGLAITDAIRRDPAVEDFPHYGEWIQKYGHITASN